MNQTLQYVDPRRVENVGDCAFYHVMDLPGVGTVGDHWDLRKTIGRYLGDFDFNGKRALDVGAASGFLTFEMERLGASVVSFDLSEGADWNLVPYASPEFDRDKLRKDILWHVDKIQNAYWYAHRVLSSSAQAYYGDIYDIPEGLGEFDVVVFGMVLPHLRDPFRALESGLRRSKEWAIITQQGTRDKQPIMHLMPNGETLGDPLSWWFMSEGCVENMLGILGFELYSKSRGDHYCLVRDRFEECTTFVARRRAGT